MKNCIQGDRGSATILMILIAAVIITVGIGFNWLVREHIRASDGLKNKAEAILKARSAYDTIIYLVLNGSVSPKEIFVSGGDAVSQLKTLPLNGEEISMADDIHIQIQESNGMLSLTTINRAPLERLIRQSGFPDQAPVAVDSLSDWVDMDTLTRINGAEDFFYSGQGLPYGPRNYALQYVDEAKLIRGLGEEVFGKIQPYVTILPSTGFNPNTASDVVLKAYLGINDEFLSALKDYIAKKPVQSDGELFSLTGKRITGDEDSVYFIPSSYMDIKVSVGQPKSIYTIHAGLRIVQKKDSPYSVLYWKEA